MTQINSTTQINFALTLSKLPTLATKNCTHGAVYILVLFRHLIPRALVPSDFVRRRNLVGILSESCRSRSSASIGQVTNPLTVSQSASHWQGGTFHLFCVRNVLHMYIPLYNSNTTHMWPFQVTICEVLVRQEEKSATYLRGQEGKTR